jgi:hypothetical protein
MKRYLLFVLLIPLLCWTTSHTHAQRLGIGGGISIPQGDFGDTYKKGFNVGIKTKIGLPFIRVTLGAAWNKFKTDEFSITTTLGTATYSYSQNIYPLSAGLEYSLIPIGPLNVYLAGDAVFSIINTSSSISGETRGIEFAKESTVSRFGAGVGPGVELKLLVISLDLSAKYHFVNLVGKVGDEKTLSYIMVNLTVFFGL